jgi:hypothetical protein
MLLCPGPGGKVRGVGTTRALRASRLLAASQLSPGIWLVPSSPLRIWSHSARGRRWRRLSGSPVAGPSPAPRPPCSGPRSLLPLPPVRWSAVTQPGISARGPGASRPPDRGARRPSTCLSVCLTRCPSAPAAGPWRAKVGTWHHPEGETSPRPSCRPRHWPRGGRVSSRPSPARDKVKLSRWRSFLAPAAHSPSRLRQSEVSKAEISGTESPPPGAGADRATRTVRRAQRRPPRPQRRPRTGHQARPRLSRASVAAGHSPR